MSALEEVRAVEWQFIVALAIAIPVIIFPIAIIWYLNIGGIYAAIKEARSRRVEHRKEVREAVKAKLS